MPLLHSHSGFKVWGLPFAYWSALVKNFCQNNFVFCVFRHMLKISHTHHMILLMTKRVLIQSLYAFMVYRHIKFHTPVHDVSAVNYKQTGNCRRNVAAMLFYSPHKQFFFWRSINIQNFRTLFLPPCKYASLEDTLDLYLWDIQFRSWLSYWLPSLRSSSAYTGERKDSTTKQATGDSIQPLSSNHSWCSHLISRYITVTVELVLLNSLGINIF
jgi:hypothetical protein